MKKTAIVGVMAAGLVLGAQVAGAAVFDFVDLEANGSAGTPGSTASGTYANGGAYNGQAGEAAFRGFTWVVDGVSLTVTGTKTDGSDAWAYLDGPWKGPAGLGVCSKNFFASTNECNPGNDDNVNAAEILHLNFDNGPEDVSFAQSVFRDADHKKYGAGQPDEAIIRVDGGAWTSLVPTGTLWSVQHIDIAFQSIDLGFNKDSDQQLYLSSLVTVPAPASVALLGLGLLGMAAVKRRKG